MKKEDLLDALRNERDNGDSMTCTIGIQNSNMDELEYITFNYPDYQYKIDFINKAYDDDLVNKSAPFIKIVSYGFD